MDNIKEETFFQNSFTILSLNLKMCPILKGDIKKSEAQSEVPTGTSFWIGETVVTQEQWYAIMKTTVLEEFNSMWNSPVKIWKKYREWVSMKELYGDSAKDALLRFTKENEGENRPMCWVNYTKALEFCACLTEKELSQECLRRGYKYTLPTEAQLKQVYRTWMIEENAKDPHAAATKQSNA